VSLCYPDIAAGAVESWLRENQGEWRDAYEAWSTEYARAEESSQSLGEATGRIGEALGDLLEAAARVAGLEAELGFRNDSLAYWRGESAARETEVEGVVSEIENALREVLVLQAE
jgi:hypothetical protein